MVNISKSLFYVIVGLLTGIIIVSMIRNGEINWEVTGYTAGTVILAFFVTISIYLAKKQDE
ncbi:hypothetical protein [Virgibacillus sp. SK37]|uniref:hypothetical protein n=1 Tax=Virgibacillus sp. SK37 TaxID=403957 RepID=UPI0004D12E51|nr:hypothetical protein [Virgibacillus sp. SK37]AIF45701.1 hypothetical protein X953_19480 [Virgibacillus sp. SK37]MYL57029.1 hypothetical protein [Virgibacillus halodenitrificans]